MLRIILIFFLISTPITGSAGVKRLVFSGIAAHTVYKIVLPSVIKGSGKAEAIAILKKISVTKKGREYALGLLSPFIITEYGSDYAKNSLDILINSGIYTSQVENELEKYKINYDNHFAVLMNISNQLDKNKHTSCFNKREIYNPDSNININHISYPLKEWDYGAYKDLLKNAKTNDNLEHDHIPSIAAIFKYLELRDSLIKPLNRRNEVGYIVNKNATAIEINSKKHSQGRTFRGKNISLFDLDSKNLKIATIKDFSYYYLKEKKISKKMSDNFANVYLRNKFLCLYE